MGLSDPVDVTPGLTFTSFQFESEVLNVFISATLISLILLNLTSVVSKLIQQTPRASFSFNSFRRFIIYIGFPEPIRVVSWLRGTYPYHEKHWKRHEQQIIFKLLLWPTFARLILLVATIGSIAITFPRETVFSGCGDGDYGVFMNSSQRPKPSEVHGSAFCVDVPLVSQIGTVTTSLDFCSTREVPTKNPAFISPTVSVVMTELGLIYVQISGNGELEAFNSFLAWHDAARRSLFTNLKSHFSVDDLLRTVGNGLSILNPDCIQGEVEVIETSIPDTVIRSNRILNCSFSPSQVVQPMVSFLSSSMDLHKVDQPQVRLDIFFENNTSGCVVDVSVNAPVVNILPLGVILVAVFVVNIGVSVVVLNRGNIVDYSYHMVKEVLGHDCTSNIIQESKGPFSGEKEISVRRVMRGIEGHVGFISQSGDQAVEDFENCVVGSGALEKE